MSPHLSTWPWDNLGFLKYMLYGPLFLMALCPSLRRQGQRDAWCAQILVLFGLRALLHQLWHTFSNLDYVSARKRILNQGVDFKQIDQEWNWDNFLILQALAATMAAYVFPWPGTLPLIDSKGFFVALSMHVVVSESIFYWTHRWLHRGYFFSQYHSLHHSSIVTQPFTAGHGTALEQLLLTVIMAIPLAVALLLGLGSTSLVYTHLLLFDFLRCMGHSNVEVLPFGLFDIFPVLKYLIYTSTYHSLHHQEMTTNFCLFMPIFDRMGKTMNPRSWELHKKISSGEPENAPEFVFLAHAVGVMSAMHVPFVFRSFSSMPFRWHFGLLPLCPGVFAIMISIRKALPISSYHLRGRLLQTWAVPRLGFQYFLPFAAKSINSQIEEAILRADKLGVMVMSLGALNKNEALNGGGAMFLDKHPKLKIRLVHGNTLTVGVLLNGIPRDCTEVFLTGATSKLGRALALYLCRRCIKVLMLTRSVERFKKIRSEAELEFQQYLVHVTKYQAAQDCENWIAGKWLSLKEQKWAPAGTQFHQFVVPAIYPFRTDCTYGITPAMHLPDDVHGLGWCEYTLNRGVVHACHAGGVVHLLEGWTHHEVGAIDVDRIDHVWAAALKHGFRPTGGLKDSIISHSTFGHVQ